MSYDSLCFCRCHRDPHALKHIMACCHECPSCHRNVKHSHDEDACKRDHQALALAFDAAQALALGAFPDDKIATPPASSAGRYHPNGDPNGVAKALVTYMKPSPDSRAYVEVLTSLGAAFDWAMDGDRNAILQQLAECLDDGETPDGLYVLTCRWIGSGEDTEFDVTDAQPPSNEERQWITENSDFQAIVHHWALEWDGVSCMHCPHPLKEHLGHELACPATPPEENEEYWPSPEELRAIREGEGPEEW